MQTPPIDDDVDYSIIGREALSTCEHLENDTVVHWINDIQMPTIDEECSSICTVDTNDHILRLVYGEIASDETEKKHNNNEISTAYFPESVVFCSSTNDQVTVGDKGYQKKTQAAADVERAEQATSELDKGHFVDYDTDRTVSLSQIDDTVIASPDSIATDQPIFEVTKQPEGDDDMPHASKCGDSSLPPPDGGCNTCRIAMDPVDKPSSSAPAVTHASHHSNQSVPCNCGDYVDHI